MQEVLWFLSLSIAAVLLLAAAVMAYRGVKTIDDLCEKRPKGLRRLGTFMFLWVVYLWPPVLVGMPAAWFLGLVGWIPACNWCIPALIIWFILNVAAPHYIGLREFAEMYRTNRPKPPSFE